ncbi:head-tail connector protein [Xanthovirga aplysinae]|uniref:head-tail connector protein n=1 Tax=Xanthovirga aplysinae TaxID=2529853 RepID=UPI0012BC412A|nr:phage head-tail connector protein [Xanthovirga aplysinae]MTI32812.1 hypothetical protein [Xanthovirga aplysinae]
MPTILKTEATTEVVTLEEAKVQLRLGTEPHEEDDLIKGFIKTAQERVQENTNRSLAPATFVKVMASFEQQEIELSYPPAISVVSITYKDEEGQEKILDPEEYELNELYSPAILTPVEDWPVTNNSPQAVKIEYEAGYKEEKCPQPLKDAMLLIISHLYEKRDEAGYFPRAAEILMNLYDLRGI